MIRLLVGNKRRSDAKKESNLEECATIAKRYQFDIYYEISSSNKAEVNFVVESLLHKIEANQTKD